MSYVLPQTPYQSRFAQVGNYKLHYLDEGKGKTLLFIHGIPEWSYLYLDVIKELSITYRCIVPDHLGFGLSDKDTSAPLTPAAHSKRLLQFIDSLNLNEINLVVHDYGGPIGIGALIERPELFSSLTISNSWLWGLKGTKTGNILKNMQGSLGKWLYLSYGFSVKFMAKNGFADKKKFREIKDVFMYHHQTKEQRYANYQLMLEMLNSSDYFDHLNEKLKALKLKGQLVWGIKDKFFTEEDFLQHWRKNFPDYKVTNLNESGHFPHMETPQSFARAVTSFI